MRITTAIPLLLLAMGASAAQAEVVMIVSARASQAPSVERVCQVFLGKLKSPLPINLMDKNPTRDAFYSNACKKDPAQVRAIWGKLIFTGTGTPPREVESGEAMRKAVADDPASVGYLDREDVDASVKIIATFN
ncbi:hypothetical protein [Massilia glaciei]|uniref:Phosphate ABC transporter substrate-binding protein n=1 Tax=Massilia glaciei TaxID=1524097 RepID=A0A2U2HDK1_9BURK|nr:hypothetical protein [Massilia glaciei]PWF41186.1 hypothetical protein C7C56_024995 [Massilia glaciei]